MRTAAIMALGAMASAVWAWSEYRLRYSPDFELYTQGGFGIYPSPLGRLLGALGETVFVSASVAAAGAVVYCVALTRAKSNSGLSAAPLGSAVLVLSPFVLYLGHAGADVIALGLYAGYLASSRTLLLLAGVFTHLALLPYAVLHVLSTSRLSGLGKVVVGYFLGGTASIVLLVTPYGGIVFGLFDGRFPQAFAQGLGAGLLLAIPAGFVYELGRVHICAFAVGALECGLQGHLQARYLLPAVVLLVATGRARTPFGGSSGLGLIPAGRPVRFAPAPGQGVAARGSSSRRLRRIEEESLR